MQPMPASRLEFLVEEVSMGAFLEACLPRILGEVRFSIYRFRGKRDLLKKLPKRLEGYKHQMSAQHGEEVRVVIIVDLDRDNCDELKSRMELACERAGLRSRQATGNSDWQVVTRIAIEELEACYFGEWRAVCRAYPRVSESIPRQASYRNPDAIKNTWETFERVLQRHGYFKQGLTKVSAATAIGKHLDPLANTSRSLASSIGDRDSGQCIGLVRCSSCGCVGAWC